MGPIGIQLWPEFQALRGTRLDAEPASLTFFYIDRNFTARLTHHGSPRFSAYPFRARFQRAAEDDDHAHYFNFH